MGNLKTEVMGLIATLLGFDGADFRAVSLDTAGQLQVDVAATDLNLGVGRLAYGEPIRLYYTIGDPGTTTYTLTGPTCPPDYVYVLTRITAVNAVGTTARITIQINDGTKLYRLSTLLSAIANQLCVVDSTVLMEAGDILEALFVTLQGTGNDVLLCVFGYAIPLL